MTCTCKKCGHTVESELWPWKAFLCPPCQKAADRAEAQAIDLHMHSAYLSHLANRMMQ
jgi:Zn finger protein HypA/HybF involved in hydrogenase expression